MVELIEKANRWLELKGYPKLSGYEEMLIVRNIAFTLDDIQSTAGNHDIATLEKLMLYMLAKLFVNLEI